jgi:hypothetical protein
MRGKGSRWPTTGVAAAYFGVGDPDFGVRRLTKRDFLRVIERFDDNFEALEWLYGETRGGEPRALRLMRAAGRERDDERDDVWRELP